MRLKPSMSRIILCFATLAAAASIAAAEPIDFFLKDGVAYDDAVPTPEAYLGFGLGDRPIRHDRFVDYLRAVAESSDRITVETIGESHEGRPILSFLVTSPDNHARLDEIRRAHRAARLGEGSFDGLPVVVWINYGVHGAESAGMDAAVPTLYHLAAARGPEIERTLEESVVVIVAIFNPDGHSRRVDHVETFSSVVPVTDPAHAQHDLWVEARTNHYWFDLNRQWLPLTQPEAQAWIKKWHEWKPATSTDMHEMGSDATYYFHPGEPARVHPLIPDRAREINLEIAEGHVTALDRLGELYYGEEGFDSFYIGKGSGYPHVNGGLGVLFEAGAARGGRVEGESGERTYGRNIRMHFESSLSMIEGSIRHKAELQAYQREFVEIARDRARQDPVKGYVFAAPGDRSALDRFAALLKSHDIAAHVLARDVEVGDVAYEAGEAMVVSMDQDQHIMAKALFERRTEFEENVFYDVSGWTIPLAFGLRHDQLDRRAYSDRLLGAEWTPRSGEVAAPAAGAYAYAFDWADRLAPRALGRLMGEDLVIRAAKEPFTAETATGPVTLGRGSIVVPAFHQPIAPEAVHARVIAATEGLGVPVHAVVSGRTREAGRDLGGRAAFGAVKEPKILLLFDDGVARYEAGEVWWTLDHEFRIPVTLRRKDDLGGIDWARYTHIILPGGGGSQLEEKAAERLGQWVREGGVLIAMRQGAAWAQKTYLKTEPKKDDVDKGDEEKDGPPRIDVSESGVREAEHVIGGALFASDLDISHPLGFGRADREIASMRAWTGVLATPEDDPYAVPARYEDAPLLSGYASERRREEIAGTPMALTQTLGRGVVILFADDPVFRGMFMGTEKMLMNAIFFGHFVETKRGDYESHDDH